MVGDLAREVLIAYSKSEQFSPRAYHSLDGDAVQDVEKPELLGPEFVQTDGVYHIAYQICTRNGVSNVAKQCPIRITTDLGDRSLRFRNWREFVKLAKTDKLARFLYMFTNINEELFKRCNPDNYGIKFAFCIDYDKYDAYVRKHAHVDKVYYNPYLAKMSEEARNAN